MIALVDCYPAYFEETMLGVPTVWTYAWVVDLYDLQFFRSCAPQYAILGVYYRRCCETETLAELGYDCE